MQQPLTAEAILFFDNQRIVKEMTYLEFQAILDNYVPLHDMATRSIGATYVRINANYHVTAAVFFRINFDSEGFVEKAWNVTLQHLADKAGKGPSMGSGPINLACFSQCPIEGQKNALWDPEKNSEKNDFKKIEKAIKNNDLGIIFNVDYKAKGQAVEQIDEGHARMAVIIKEQRLRQKSRAAKAEQDIRQLQYSYQEQTQGYQQRFDTLEQALKNEKEQYITLENKSQGQLEKIAGMREYFEVKLEKLQQNGAVYPDLLKEYYDTQVELESDRLAAEYTAQLRTRDVELLYRREQEALLQQVIITLKSEKKELVESSKNHIFNHLADAGINFVTYHPGIGQLTIEADEIDHYLSNIMAFVASKCGVDETLYLAWLEHYYSPRCQHKLESGQLCDEPVAELEQPRQFVIDESNCCAEHRKTPKRVVFINSSSTNDMTNKPKNLNGPSGLAL